MYNKKGDNLDAEITVKFIIEDVCDNGEVDDDFFCLEDYVQDKINESGFSQFLDDLDSTYEITNVRKTG
jgi:hypothetical protein